MYIKNIWDYSNHLQSIVLYCWPVLFWRGKNEFQLIWLILTTFLGGVNKRENLVTSCIAMPYRKFLSNSTKSGTWQMVHNSQTMASYIFRIQSAITNCRLTLKHSLSKQCTFFARTETTPISEHKLLIHHDMKSLSYQEIFPEDYRPI